MHKVPLSGQISSAAVGGALQPATAINFSAASSPLCIPTPIHFIRSWPGQLCRYPCLPSLSRVVRRRSDSGEDGRDKINACRVGVVACIFQEDEQSELWWWCEDNENQHIIGFWDCKWKNNWTITYRVRIIHSAIRESVGDCFLAHSNPREDTENTLQIYFTIDWTTCIFYGISNVSAVSFLFLRLLLLDSVY